MSDRNKGAIYILQQRGRPLAAFTAKYEAVEFLWSRIPAITDDLQMFTIIDGSRAGVTKQLDAKNWLLREMGDAV